MDEETKAQLVLLNLRIDAVRSIAMELESHMYGHLDTPGIKTRVDRLERAEIEREKQEARGVGHSKAVVIMSGIVSALIAALVQVAVAAINRGGP